MPITKKHLATALAGALLAGGSHAATLRWASANDLLTLDPHAQNHLTTLTVLQQVYEGLTRYDRNYQVVPALATEWEFVTDTQVRFKLREGVTFHDGSPMSADDVVFSLNRAMTPPSNMMATVQSIREVKKIDDHTVDLILKSPSPVLLRELVGARILSKAWAEKHNVLKAQNFAAREESYASRNANGTGPFVMVGWQPDVRTTMRRNDQWWDTPQGNISEWVFTPIRSSATRTAALISGQVDILNDPPPQDLPRMARSPDLKILEGTEYRTIFIGMDQHRDQLQGSSLPENPLKDVRVRQALYQAIDIQALHKSTMRGQSIPAGTMIAPMIHGWSEQLDQRASAYDPEAARSLLAEAGYPDGFALTLDCPNDRYVNDEAICQAVTAMWTRVGVKTRLNSHPNALFVNKILNNDVSAYLYGWGVATFDAFYTLNSLMHTPSPDGGAAGNYNIGRISNPELDAAIEAARAEMNPEKRDAAIAQALQITKDQYHYLPLHHQIRPWAMHNHVDTPYRSNDAIAPQWTTVN